MKSLHSDFLISVEGISAPCDDIIFTDLGFLETLKFHIEKGFIII